VATTVINDDLLIVDWDKEADDSCTITAWSVKIVKSDAAYELESTYCSATYTVANNMCAVPISVVTAAPYSLSSGDTITVEVQADCSGLTSSWSTATGSATVPSASP